MQTTLFWMAVFLSIVDVTFQTTLHATYNMGGVTGTVTFSQNNAGESVTITLDLTGVAQGSYMLNLHEFRVNFDTADRCSASVIGGIIPNGNIGQANVTSGYGSLSVGGIDLSGSKSIEGRSLELTNNGNLRVCATIEADAEYITAFAHLPAGLGGTIIFRQQENSPSADTFIYTNLFFVTGAKTTTSFNWQINSGTVKMDIDASTDLNNRCGSTIGDMYNPDSPIGTGCSTDSHRNCEIGNLTAKHGEISVNADGNTKAFFGDLHLPLSGDNSIIGKTVSFLIDSNYFACANIVQYPRMAAVAKFSNDGVKGQIEFRQKSPLDAAQIHVDLSNLKLQGGGYHVHLWPVPQKVLETDNVCDGNSVGGHFDPFSTLPDPNYPSSATSTPDRYEVGDLSGKFGLLSTMDRYNKSFTDPNLQLFGRNSIVGRSLVIHKNMDGAPRWVCTTILTTDDTPMVTAVAKFTYPVIGYMIFRQAKNKWFAETQVYAELDYATSSFTPTVNHNWHVHEHQMGDDMLVQSNRCQSVGAHFNPYGVFLQGDYNSQCSPSNPFRCELGDLSGKHGKLTIRTDTGKAKKYFFTDYQLPLMGPQSILGKSITIHDANSGGGRLACADVIEKMPRVAAVTSWTTAGGQTAPSGSIKFTQNCTEIFSCMTSVDVHISNLRNQASGYHIHEFPTDPSTSPDSLCQASDVGGHVNPFKAPYPGPPSTTGSMDQYEIGDLSGKFSPLTGEAYSTNVLDMNLPMKGPLSIVGRSIVIHKNDATASRWACGNILEITPGGHLVAARATFEGTIRGTVHMSQYVYANGDRSDTNIIVNLRYGNNTKTTGHNWHVHERPVSTDCASCGPHYNPFMVDMTSSMYSTECSPNNPLRCEVGDQAGKLGAYDIGGGKRFYTDVNLNLEGKFAAAKRSFVIHGPNGIGDRVACANILPYGDDVKMFDLSFLTTDYSKYELEAKVADSIGTDVDNILAIDKSRGLDCTTVTIYFLGTEKGKLYMEFRDVIRSNNHKLLGKFSPDLQCTSAAGLLQVSVWTIFACLLLIWNRHS